ncbi:zinc finger CCCH domain-containing protein 55-like isoform X2 [Andrographis paniculata]|uniref:zinc finger CCCH domain-containing protein 55-like isoform X2 n=1 Tax=Andrographis paniculata TaxID=175694 RepID=UPI0021E92B52|nr:zinc finger CCCH domain-containing protein 55-like isoform X2 [Andrographis paniculata]
MDVYEAVQFVLPKIRSLDPENAPRIIYSILTQHGGEKEMIRLAFLPDAVFLSYINRMKSSLGLCPDGSSSNPSSSSPPLRPVSPPQLHIFIPDSGSHLINSSSFQKSSPKPASYADVLSGSRGPTLSGSPSLPFYGGGDDLYNGGDDTLMDPIVSPSGNSDSLIFPYVGNMNRNSSISSSHSYPFHHRRSFSVNDAAILSGLEEGGGGGFGWKPCVYYARGYCKNGSSCKFIHSDIMCGGESFEMGSPSRPAAADSGFDELLRFKALQQQKFALMASGGGGGRHHFHYNKFLTGNQRINGCGPNRNDFLPMGFRPGENSSMHQIYLTFPADSTFSEDDVFVYFSKFGPVQDVRIPHQQKRMFGFVSFYYPETVKRILAKGNPHFVCDCRVLVKPYKEKGKFSEKKQLQRQYSDRGEFASSLSSAGIDSSELVDLPIGPRMFVNQEEMIRRRKIEQEMELQQMLELQGRRLVNLQVSDRENPHLNNFFVPNIPGGALMNRNNTRRDVSEEFCGSGEADEKLFKVAEVPSSNNNNVNVNANAINHQRVNDPNSYFLESNFEHALPDNLFSSPTKLATEQKIIFSHESVDVGDTGTNTTTEKRERESLA